VMQQDNVDTLHRLPKMCADHGIDVLNFVTETRMHDLPGLGDVDPAVFSFQDLLWPKIERKALSEALDATEREAKRWGVELRLPRMPRKHLLDYYDPGGQLANIDLGEYECRNAWNTVIIGRQGDVHSCWIKKVGNVRENTISEIWGSDALRDFRQQCQKGLFAPCAGCCLVEHKTDRSCR